MSCVGLCVIGGGFLLLGVLGFYRSLLEIVPGKSVPLRGFDVVVNIVVFIISLMLSFLSKRLRGTELPIADLLILVLLQT